MEQRKLRMPSQKKKSTIVDLLSILPNEQINAIARKTNVNYYVKVLDGKSVFCLLLYSLIECQRNSLRTMEDIFNSTAFKFLFNLDNDKTVKYNSISERLSVINVDFFKQVYELIYSRFSELYSEQEIENYKLIRVDSTLVTEAANKVTTSILGGRRKGGNKLIKYTVAYDGKFPCMAEIFTDKQYACEDLTIPKVVYQYAKRSNDSVFVFDRGVSKREVYSNLSHNSTLFVTRLRKKTRYRIVEELETGNNRKLGKLELIGDYHVQLGKPNTQKYIDELFRLIIATNAETQESYSFLTNMFDESVEDILVYYKKRWDIEVFFRFLKQELNFSHITSTSENGMQVMLYMTLIASMLVLIYKRANNVGYKTAVRRIALELNEMIIKLVVKHCGGDPKLVFR